MADRIKKAAATNRAAAQTARDRGKDTAADKYTARAEALESGRVTDRTDEAIGLVRAAFRR
jgi:hypothetical protein